MQKLLIQKSKRLLLLLILGDILFVALHIVLEIPHYTNYPAILELPFYHSYLLTVDGSWAEWYQYLKFGAIIWAFHSLLRQTGEKGFWAWGLFFSFLLLDDSLRIHERLGEIIATLLNIAPILGLRGKDFGELITLFSIGGLLFVCLIIAYLHGSQRFKKIAIDMFVLVTGLAVFVIIVDFLHSLFDTPIYALVLGTLEDSGEMFMVSFVLWYVYRLVHEAGQANLFLVDELRFLNLLPTKMFLSWHVDFSRFFNWFKRICLPIFTARRNWLIFGGYLCFVAVLTQPVLRELGATIPGNEGDAYVHLWVFEWVRDALRSGDSPFFTRLMFFPDGTELFSHNIPWLNIAFWLPLQAVVGSASAYSLLFVGTFVFNACCGFWLAQALTKDRVAAFVGGLVIGGWPYTLAQFSRPNLVLMGFVPLAMWSILRVCETGKRKYVIFTTVFLAAIGITRFQLLGISLVLLLPWALLCLWTYRELGLWVRVRQFLLAGCLAGLAIAPFVFPLVWHQLNRDFPSDLYVVNQVQFLDLLSHIVPSNDHVLFSRLVRPFRFELGVSFFLGSIPLFLFFYAVFKRAKFVMFWLVSFIVLFVLGLGDVLVVNGESFFGLPYGWLRGTTVAGLVGNPGRFNVLTSIPFGVVVAFGVKGFFERIEVIYRPIIFSLLIIYITTEYQLNYATLDLNTPAWYSELAQESGDFGILPIPHNRDFSERYLNYQRAHHKGIVEGHVSRVPREAYAFIRNTPLLSYLQEHSATANMVEPPTAMPNLTLLFDPLVEADIRYFVIHKSFMHIDIVNRWREWLAVEPVFEDGEVLVYDTNLVESADNQSIALVQAVNTTPNKRSNQTTQFVTHWIASPDQRHPDEICLSLAISETCQPFDVTITADNQLIRTEQSLTLDKTIPPDTYSVKAQFKANGVAVSDIFELTQVELTGVARLFETPTIATTRDRLFGNELKLLGHDDTEQTDQTLSLTLYWQALVEQSRHTKYFIHIIDSDNNVVAQIDTVPRDWSYPTTEWAEDEIVSDTVTIDISAIEEGTYQIVIGMVDIELGNRLLLQDGTDSLTLDTLTK